MSGSSTWFASSVGFFHVDMDPAGSHMWDSADSLAGGYGAQLVPTRISFADPDAAAAWIDVGLPLRGASGAPPEVGSQGQFYAPATWTDLILLSFTASSAMAALPPLHIRTVLQAVGRQNM